MITMDTEGKDIDTNPACEALYNHIMSPGIMAIPPKIYKGLHDCYKKLTEEDFEPLQRTIERTYKVGDHLPSGSDWLIVGASCTGEVVLRQSRPLTLDEIYDRLHAKIWRYATHNYLNATGAYEI